MTVTLYVTPTIPRPDGIGVQKRAWAHLQTLRALGEVQLWVLLTPPQHKAQGGERALDAARALAGTANLALLTPLRELVVAGGARQRLRQRIAQFGMPRHRLAAAHQEQELADKLAAGAFDMVFFFRTSTLSTLQHLLSRARRSPPWVTDFDDVESVAQARELRHTWRALGIEASLFKVLDIVDQWKLERFAQRHANMVSVCSDHDAERLRRRGGPAQVLVIPNTIPDRLPLPPAPTQTGVRLLFIGALNYEPNEDAALHLVRDILPLIRHRCGNGVRLLIVGRSPTPAVRALQSHVGVEVHGDVADVESFYQASDIVVAPIRFGGGTRIKIIEAMAMGRPVVSTRLGAEGLGLRDGHDVLLADDANGFAQACCRLASKADLRAKLAAHGFATYQAGFSETLVRTRVVDRLQALLPST